jgi:hypothetical protein
MSSAWERYKLLSLGWTKDGHPHERDDNGFCGTCGATRYEPHYRCVPKHLAPEHIEHPTLPAPERNDHQ